MAKLKLSAKWTGANSACAFLAPDLTCCSNYRTRWTILLIAAQMAALVSRVISGRKVDVRPNPMRLPIHEIAFKEGQLL